jgi:NAD(P)-dependent dehydrogenase (short-subunit alcohol dehydrogenase family)
MANPQPFLGKVITITGAARGIGLATAVYLAVHGADLSLADVQQNELELIRDKIQHKYPTRTVFSYQVDVSDPEAVNNWIDRTIEVFGRIDGCVNNAGLSSLSSALLHEIHCALQTCSTNYWIHCYCDSYQVANNFLLLQVSPANSDH